MHRVLREHAIILRSQADELDAVADVLERNTSTSAADMLQGYAPRNDAVPVIDPDEPDTGPDAIRAAVLDGRVDVTYNLTSLHHVNEEASLQMAKHDALRGKIVLLDYGDEDRNQIWTKETFANDGG